MHGFRRLLPLAAGLFAIALTPAGYASTLSLSFSGTFTYDNDVRLFNVTLGAPESLLAYTTSGATGGFPTFLMLFDASGNPVQQQSGDPACLAGYSSYSPAGICNDAYLLEPTVAGLYLDPGKYTVALVQWDNYWSGSLSDGFIYDGAANRNFTNASFGSGPQGLCGTGTIYFCDPSTMTADGSRWAITFALTSAGDTPAPGDVTTPEPGSALLCLGGLGTLLLSFRLRRAGPLT